MKKSTWIVVAVVVVAIILLVIRNSGNGQAQTIKIGVVAPLTGGASGYGVSLIKGIELAKQDFAVNFPKANNKYEVIFEDDGTNPAQSASAAQKLVNIDKVSAIITTTSGTGNAVKPIVTAAGIPHICICVDTRLTEGNKTNFIYLALPEIESRAWVDEAVSRGLKKVAIIAQNHPGFNLIIDDPTTKDFKTVIAKARVTNPDVYLAFAFPPSLDILGTTLKSQGIKNVSGLGTLAISADSGIFEGDWFTDVKLSDLSYKDRFEKVFPDIRFNARTAPEGYDAMNILVSAHESKKDAS
ncbi:MAG: ABC transporter substrate-binding protein, partial [Candidatus Taylorbacteria bacterium]|nr:ABC transporter substrate-binding protein [Candidatus Taylorbacteria bacterium]